MRMFGNALRMWLPKPQAATIVVAASDSLHPERADYHCVGVNDQVEIMAAHAAANGGKVVLQEGTFNWTGEETINDCLVEGQGKGTIINLTSDASTIRINLHGNLRNVKVNVSSGYTGTAVIVGNGAGTRGIGGEVGLLDGVKIWNEGGEGTVTGIGLQISSEATGAVNQYAGNALNSFGHIHIHGFEYGMKLYATETDAANPGFVDGNNFDSIVIEHSKYMLILNGVGTAECQGNIFAKIQQQPGSGTDGGIHISGYANSNKFLSIMSWDWLVADGISLEIDSGISLTYAMGYLPFYTDSGSENTIIHLDPMDEQHVIVKDTGGHYKKLSSALTAIIAESPAVDKRFVVDAFGIITDDAAGFPVPSHVDVIGHGAIIECTAVDDTPFDFYTRTDILWRDLTIKKTGVAAATYRAVIGLRGTIDETVRFENCKFLDDTTGAANHYGGHIVEYVAAHFSHCHFRGGQGVGASYGVALRLDGLSTPTFIDCLAEGGSGGNHCHGWRLEQGCPRLERCIGMAGDNQATARAFNLEPQFGGELINCSTELYKYGTKWEYDDADNGQFRPYDGHPYQLIAVYVQVVVANVGVTLDLGTSIAGTEIATAIDIGTTGTISFDFNRVEVAADGYMYATPSAGINDDDVRVYYVVVKNYANVYALYLNSKGYAVISGGHYLANGASDALYINETTIKNWRMSGAHLETLDPTNQKAINAAGALTDVPVYYCTLVGGLTNITSFAEPKVRQDKILSPTSLDLSGGATDLEAYHAVRAGHLLGYTILYTEASSADAGVDIRIGRYQDGVALDGDYFDISTSEVSKNKGYSKHFAIGDLTQTVIAAGDTVTVGIAGGKTGTGEIIIILEIEED